MNNLSITLARLVKRLNPVQVWWILFGECGSRTACYLLEHELLHEQKLLAITKLHRNVLMKTPSPNYKC